MGRTEKELILLEPHFGDNVRYFVDKGKEVIYDAEHFYDGFVENPKYAMQTIKVAAENGASTVVLCDTRGGSIPSYVKEVTKFVVDEFAISFPNIVIGIHAHNDASFGDANSVMAVEAGALHVQGTLTGFGERSGNANLAAIIPTLELKMGFDVLGKENLSRLFGTNSLLKIRKSS
jgi:2-isopropylmalate synthase